MMTPEFYRKLVDICARLHCSPVDMASVMYSESGLSPKAKNPHADANGLIQFMGDTLRGLGWTKGSDAFRELSAVEQLDWVERYYQPHASAGLESAARLYLATFLPALLRNEHSHDETFVLCAERGPLAWAYAANKAFDPHGNGHITLGDLGERLRSVCRGERWESVLSGISDAIGPEIESRPALPPVPYSLGMEYVLDEPPDDDPDP